MSEQGKRREILAALAVNPMTVDQFVTASRLYVNSWAPVFTHLRKEGLVERTGEQRPTVNGSKAHVLRLTDTGRAMLRAGGTA